MTEKKSKLFFLCYPHIGILDNWMSIINSLKSVDSRLECVLIIPKPIAVRAFHMDNAIVKISNNLFDNILVYGFDNIWIKHKSVVDCIQWYQNSRYILRTLNILMRLMKNPVFSISLRWLYFFLRNKIYFYENKIEFENLKKYIFPVDMLLYDIASHNKTYLPVRNILRLFENNNKYSLPHAVTIQSAIEDKTPNLVSINNKNSIQVYVHSECQIKFKKKKYHITKNRIYLVGIPTHDHTWIKKIQEESAKLPENFDDKNTIVIISKRVSDKFSFDEKVKTLKNIKKVFVDKFGMCIAVKLHPTEKKERVFRHKLDDIYKNIFGASNYGLTWVFSDLHALALCKEKKLVISLGGSVAYDIIALGVPCVEYKYKKTNEKIIATQFVKYGFIEGVSNFNEINTFAERLLDNPCQFYKTSEIAYNTFFPSFDDSSIMVANRILNKKIVN